VRAIGFIALFVVGCGGAEKGEGGDDSGLSTGSTTPTGGGPTTSTTPSGTTTPTTTTTTTPSTTTTTVTTLPTTSPTTTTSGAFVPEFGEPGTRSFITVGSGADGLKTPRDLDFHPDRPTELWTSNKVLDGHVIFMDPDTPEQMSRVVEDYFGNHFMEEVSSMAFGADDTFATCQESRNTYDGTSSPDDFMGPTFWPADLEVYAQVNQSPFGALGGSHLDMLHQSPNCMGIAHAGDHAYWAFDGLNGHIVYYDFRTPHEPGGHDHSDGIVRRYTEVQVERVEYVPSHMLVDDASGLLFIADTGNARVLTMDTASGRSAGTIPPHFEILAEFSEWTDVDHEVLVSSGLVLPSGIALADDRLFVSDFETGQIVAYAMDGRELDRIDLPDGRGVMGITIGPEGYLWYVDGLDNLLIRIDPG
jgi:hypothetical protein